MPDACTWAVTARPEDRVADVARRTLSCRLCAVARWLPLAALRQDADGLSIHRLRVATRRACAAVSCYRPLLHPTVAENLLRRLNRVRRRAGSARDLDVLRARYAQSPQTKTGELIKKLAQADRQAAQAPLRKICRQAESVPQFIEVDLAELVPEDQVQTSPGNTRFGKWARRRMNAFCQAFFDSQPLDFSDWESLHQWRIQGKQLRYVIELLAPACDDEMRTTVYPALERLQSLLGQVNDHRTAAHWLRQWRRSQPSSRRQRKLKRLRRREQRAANRAMQRVAEWWTPGRARVIERALRRSIS